MALGTKALKELARSLDAARDCLRDSAGGDDTPAVDELGAYREGQLLKKQLLEARASRLCRFLELTGGSGCTPRAATSGVSSGGGGGGGGGAHWGAQSKGQTPAVRRRLGSLDDSAEEADSSPRGGRKAAHWHSPVSVLEGAGACFDACSTPGSSRSDDSEQAAASLPLTPVPCALDDRQQAAAGRATKPPPPPPPMPPPPGVVRLGGKWKGSRGAATSSAPAAWSSSQGATGTPTAAASGPAKPALPGGALPAHLAAPAPKEGVQRRPIHLDGVYAKNARGSLWEQPPPGQEAADPAAAVRVGALDRLFAKQLAVAAEEEGSAAGSSPAASPQRPSAPGARQEPGGLERALSGSGGSEAGGTCGSPGAASLASRGSLSLGRQRPIIRLFTGGRKAVNIEILMRKLPADVAQAVAELDTSRLQVAVLRELQANLPDAAELEALHSYLDAGGDPCQLGRAEQLFVALRGTARLQQKLQVLIFKGGLQEQAGEVTEPLARIVAALDQLRASPALRLLLHTALRLGNTLNAGRKAPQRGIRLASLRKLADTRSMDGSTTLMHYLVALLLEEAPGALLLGKPGSQCEAVPAARHWTFAELESQLGSLSAGIDMVRQEQRAARGGEQRQLAALAGQASALVQRAQQLLAAARQKAADTLRFLGEDVAAEPALSTAEPRRMLGDLADFFALLHRAAHADAERLTVVLDTMQRQRDEEEAERRRREEEAEEEERRRQSEEAEGDSEEVEGQQGGAERAERPSAPAALSSCSDAAA
ncbi:hypothetical protein CHLNCDRAFT_141254 [Chlorella variabilis]|uniref:Formin-like protein n=1 Tax=Chlorella variabilis TaxID=554065 RepID=E1ZSG0_CHLVA|nr:hypothetical protein CHLNCDRAFT_141254 [Chlorella variabilis]EFN51238.1 hypothetical protein CHLNCDRAFT_141254 [Chlorella variabilis]|eukprot:XP_005843340.1 hypothetical protein CHLNCDRAFT_141254 [Chlorella variabilis]